MFSRIIVFFWLSREDRGWFWFYYLDSRGLGGGGVFVGYSLFYFIG